MPESILPESQTIAGEKHPKRNKIRLAIVTIFILESSVKEVKI